MPGHRRPGEMTGRKMGCFKLNRDSAAHAKEVYHIVLLGGENVGKTALVVRFLARKYLSEYAHPPTTCYERNLYVDGKLVTIRVSDTSGREPLDDLHGKGVFQEADGYAVVYSITEKASFEKASDIMQGLLEAEIPDGRIPIALWGNKEDLLHLREVNNFDGQRFALCYPGCCFREVSAARDADNVHTAFQELLRQVVLSKDARKAIPHEVPHLHAAPRRSSVGTLTSFWKRRPRFNSLSVVKQEPDRTMTM